MKHKKYSASLKDQVSKDPKGNEVNSANNENWICDENSDYEQCRWPYILSLPFMHSLTFFVIIKKKIFKIFGLGDPKYNSLFFDGLGVECRNVKKFASTWKAMDIIYNHPFPKRHTFRGLIDEFYWHGMNCQALRNRRKLMKKELQHAILQIETNGSDIRLLSLACGSADTTIETVAEFKDKKTNISAVLIDIDAEALSKADMLARNYNVVDQVTMQNISAFCIDEICKNFKPHIVEMFGLFDYYEQNEVIALAEKIYKHLDQNGIFLTSNISPNLEQHFLKWVINWPMIYRDVSEISEIARIPGFQDYYIVYEPLKIHGILVAKK